MKKNLIDSNFNFLTIKNLNYLLNFGDLLNLFIYHSISKLQFLIKAETVLPKGFLFHYYLNRFFKSFIKIKNV